MYRPDYTIFRNGGFRTGQRSLGEDIVVPNLPTALASTRAFYVGGRVWVMSQGGRPGYSWAPGDKSWRAEAIDPQTEHICLVPNHGGYQDLNNLILAVGGSLANTSNKSSVFNTTTRAWTTSAAYPGYIGFIGGSILMPYDPFNIMYMCGCTANSRMVTKFQSNGSNSNALPDELYAVAGMDCVTPCFSENGNEILMLGGSFLNQRFVAGAWVDLGARAGSKDTRYGAGVRLSYGDYVLTGGTVGAAGSKVVQRWTAGAWTDLPNMTVGRWVHSSVVLPKTGAVFVAGGIDHTGAYTAKSEAYIGGAWIDTGNMSEAKAKMAAVLLPAPYNAYMVIGGTTALGDSKKVEVFIEGKGWGNTIPA